MTLADILRAGKAAIEAKGWVQGDEEAFDGRNGCCVATSMSSGGGLGPINMDAVNVFKTANGINPMIGLGTWNDDPARTKEEVLAAFDKAIALAEQEKL